MTSGRPLRPGLLLAAVLVAVVAAYSNAIAGPFAWDDRLLIQDNPAVHRLGNPARHFTSVFWAKSASYEANPVYYRPLVTLSYAADWVRSGGDPDAFHLTNVLLHLAAVALLFVVARRLGAAPAAAALAAVLFGLAPRLTESVAWISGRTDVLATILALGAVAVHATDAGAHGRRAFAAILLLAALFAKEVGMAGLAAVAVLEVRRNGPLRDRPGRIVAHLAPAFAAVAIYAALRLQASGGAPPAGPFAGAQGLAGVLLPIQALGANLLMLLDPLRPRLQIGLARQVSAAYLAAGVAALALLLLAVRRGVRVAWTDGVWAGLAFAGTGVALVLQLFPIRVNVVSADRFLYVPLAGLAVALAVAAERFGPRVTRWALVASVAAVPLFGFATHARNADWADELRLWRVAVETTPEANTLPRLELANVLTRRGHYREALRQVERALPHAPPHHRSTIQSNLAALWSELGEYERAAEALRVLSAAEPGIALHRYNLGVVEARRLRFDEAERELRQAGELLPGYADAARALEVVAAARRELAALEAEPPGTATDARRARVWERLGRTREAEVLWTRVLEASDARTEDLRSAVAFLVRRGSPASAERAIARAAESAVAPAEVLEDLRTALAARSAERAEATRLP
jgi:tetratricopeptide (TPR) repeat protein